MSLRYISHQSPGPASVQAPAGFAPIPSNLDEGGFLQVLGTLETTQEGMPEAYGDKPEVISIPQAATLIDFKANIQEAITPHPLVETNKTAYKTSIEELTFRPYADEPRVRKKIGEDFEELPDNNDLRQVTKEVRAECLPHEMVILEACTQNTLPNQDIQKPPASTNVSHSLSHLMHKPTVGMRPASATQELTQPHIVEEARANTLYDLEEACPQANFQVGHPLNQRPAIMAMAFTPFSTAGTTLLAHSVPMPLHSSLPMSNMVEKIGMDEDEWAHLQKHIKGKGPRMHMGIADDGLTISSTHTALKHQSTEPSMRLDLNTHSGHTADALTPQNRAENIEIMLNVADAFRANVQRRHTHFRIPIRHETWGDVEVRLSIGKDQSVTASFLTDSDNMMRLLNTHRQHLEDILANAGLTCIPDNFHVIRHKETNI